ncbi:MAG TPA: HPF/RaiA family ribosome-associated protein [Methylomirabilota bacterium]|nr:HPF/RaiA family ribosome-associated protein [Methylomirabilota bacterium]
MTIEINGINRDAALRTRVMRQIRAALDLLTVSPVRVQAVFVDDNGPKGGGIRCAFTVRVPYKPFIRVERTAETPRLAFDQAFAALERRLERYRERDRDAKRHPKKYFVAKRLLTGELAPPGPKSPRRSRRAPAV